MGCNERIPGYVVRDAVCYASLIDPMHATIEELAADGYTHVYLPHDEVEADQLVPRIALDLTVALLSARLRYADGGASL